MGNDGTLYTEFELDGQRVAGGMEMVATVPAEVPSYWGVYFNVEDVDGATRTAIDAGARPLQEPMDFSGGRFSILTDPQGAAFGVLKLRAGF